MKKFKLSLVSVFMIVAFVSLSGPLSTEGTESKLDQEVQSQTKLTGKYLLSFHACNTTTTNCNDPRNHQTYVSQSDDGISWQPIPGYTSYFGSVPDLIRRDNTLYVYNPGKVRRYRIDKDTWEDPILVSIKNSDGSLEDFVDPTLILDSNRKIILFYLVGIRGQDPAMCPQGQASCTKIFHSATEVDGSDGTQFKVDSGNRAEVAITSNETASDPDIFKGDSSFILYISKGPSVLALSSNTLQGTYATIPGLPNGLLVSNSGGVPAGYYDPINSLFWTYVTKGTPGVPSVIRRAVHPSVNTSITDSQFSTIISGATYPGLGSTYITESPGFAVNDTGPITSPTPVTLPTPTVSTNPVSTPTPTVSTNPMSTPTPAIPVLKLSGENIFPLQQGTKNIIDLLAEATNFPASTSCRVFSLGSSPIRITPKGFILSPSRNKQSIKVLIPSSIVSNLITKGLSKTVTINVTCKNGTRDETNILLTTSPK